MYQILGFKYLCKKKNRKISEIASELNISRSLLYYKIKYFRFSEEERKKLSKILGIPAKSLDILPKRKLNYKA